MTMKRNIPTNLILTAAAACLLLLPVTAVAQNAMSLSLDEAIDIAITGNNQLKIDRLGIDYSEAQIDEAFSNVYPQVSATGQYMRNLKPQVFYFPGPDGVSQPIEVGSDNQVTANLTVNQIVFNDAVFTGVGTAETYSQIARQQLRTTGAQVVLNVKRAYLGALFARELLAVNQALLMNAQENFNNVKVLADAGLRAEFDKVRAEVQVSNQRPVVLESRDAYHMALDNLKLVLGLPGDTEIELEESLARPASLAAVEPSVEEARRILAEYNPQLKTLELSREVNEKLIRINGADKYPTVSVFGTLQFQAQSNDLFNLPFKPTAFVGLNMSYTIFNGWQTSSKVEQARVQTEQSRLQLEQTQLALSTQLGAVLRQIHAARERIESTEKTIELAQRGYKIATVAYKAGTGTQLQINDADLALAQAKVNQLSAVHDYRVALAELESLLGEHVQLINSDTDVKYSQR